MGTSKNLLPNTLQELSCKHSPINVRSRAIGTDFDVKSKITSQLLEGHLVLQQNIASQFDKFQMKLANKFQTLAERPKIHNHFSYQ